MNRIYRYGVPVDDQWHVFPGCTPPLHVACRKVDTVEFWAFAMPPDAPPGMYARAYRVYGTGHEIEPNATYVGTTLAPVHDLVWHLMAKWVRT